MKLSELTAENIRNTKIHVKNEHESKAFQERVFELGGKWCDNDKSVSKEYMPFLLIDGALNMHRKITSERMEYTEPPNVELQIDFTNKPDWSDAPEWAQWLAQDGGGSWWWYAIKPSESAGGWMENDHACAKHWPGFYIPNPTWYDTLEQRPNHVVDTNEMVDHIPGTSKIIKSTDSSELSLRDKFAIKFAKELMKGEGYANNEWPHNITEDAYKMADAMMSAREVK